MKRIFVIGILSCAASMLVGQSKSLSLTKGKYGDGPDSIAPVGIIKNLRDDQLL